MIKEILESTDARLRQKSKPITGVDKKIVGLIKDLKDTLIVQDDPEGIGLAAPQIGKNVRIFVMRPDKKIRTIINPEILTVGNFKDNTRDKKGDKVMEGCLSLPHYYGPIKRPTEIKLKFLNEKGSSVEEVFNDLEAQIVQHEIDHLNGILFIDRLLEQNQPLYEYIDGDWEKVEI